MISKSSDELLGDTSAVSATLSQYFPHVAALKRQQELAISSVLLGRDVLLCLPTGAGKSLCFQLPSLLQPQACLTIVISPLLALMANQIAALKAANLPCALLNSTVNVAGKDLLFSHLKILATKAVLSSKDNAELPRLLYLTPEAAVTKPELLSLLDGIYRQGRLRLIAIDECHCISSWGHTFRPSYRGLKTLRIRFPKVAILACTATATLRVREDVVASLQMRSAQMVTSSFDRPNIRYEVRYVATLRRSLEQDLVALIKASKGRGGGLIYAGRRADTERLAKTLIDAGLSAAAYHGAMPEKTRLDVQGRWEKNKLSIVVSTLAFGMGIHRDRVNFVIHSELPKSLEAYYQESGRAGRDGSPAFACLYYSAEDAQRLQALCQQEDRKSKNGDLHTAVLFKHMKSYCESATCRRERLLGYFGDDSIKGVVRDRGRCCDYCRDPAAATAALQKCLSTPVVRQSETNRALAAARKLAEYMKKSGDGVQRPTSRAGKRALIDHVESDEEKGDRDDGDGGSDEFEADLPLTFEQVSSEKPGKCWADDMFDYLERAEQRQEEFAQKRARLTGSGSSSSSKVVSVSDKQKSSCINTLAEALRVNFKCCGLSALELLQSQAKATKIHQRVMAEFTSRTKYMEVIRALIQRIHSFSKALRRVPDDLPLDELDKAEVADVAEVQRRLHGILRQQSQASLDGPETQRLLSAMYTLEIDRDLLSRTKIGRDLNSLRKRLTRDGAQRKLADALLTQWKSLSKRSSTS